MGPSAQFEIVKLKEILTGLEMMTQRLIRERPIEFGIHVGIGRRHHRKRRAKAATDSGPAC